MSQSSRTVYSKVTNHLTEKSFKERNLKTLEQHMIKNHKLPDIVYLDMVVMRRSMIYIWKCLFVATVATDSAVFVATLPVEKK